MVSRRTAGFTLVELVVAMFVFGIFLWILIMLTAEMRNHEKTLPVNFMKHPQVSAVVSRLRRDVLDAVDRPYDPPYPTGYRMGPQVLIIRTVEPDGRKSVVWDFREPGVVTRRSFNVGIAKDWTARGLPEDSYVEIDAVEIAGRNFAVRLIAKDRKGRIAIDQIFVPRAHQ